MPVLITLLKAFPHFLSFYFMLKVNPYLTLIILVTTRGNNTCFLISLKKSESFEQIIFTVSFNWRLWRETSSSKPFHNLLLRKTKASKFYFSSSAAGTTVPLSFLSSEGVRNFGSRSSQRLSLLDAPCEKEMVCSLETAVTAQLKFFMSSPWTSKLNGGTTELLGSTMQA